MKELVTSHCPLSTDNVPDSWELVGVGEIVNDIQTGFASGKHNSDGIGISHLRPMNISPEGRIDLADRRFVKGESPLRLRRGDVLFNNTNSPAWVGKTALVGADGELAFSNHMTRLRVPSEIEPAFVAKQLHFLCSSGYFLHQCKKHVNQASINRKFLSDSTPFMLPPEAEQRRIVAKIEALQERSRKAREALEEVKPLLEQFRQSLLAAAFRGDLTADWREQHPDVEPASELLARIRKERREKWEQAELAKYEAKGKKPPKGWQEKYIEPEPVDDSELPELPEGWCWSKVEEICTHIVDCPHSTPKWAESGKLCVRTTAFRAGELDLTHVKYVSVATFESRIRRLRPESGDVLYSREGGILGIACQIPEDVELCLGQRMMLMRSHKDVLGTLLMHWLNSPLNLARVRRLTSGSASPHLNVGDVKTFPIPIPPIDEQSVLLELITTAFSSMSQVHSCYSGSVEHVSQLDQSILAKAFRGELVPQDPNDEPASVLLERIREQREANKKGQPKRKGRSKAPSRTDEEQRRLNRGQVVLDVLLLLEAWGMPVSIAPLEAALVLMRCPELRKSFLKARRQRKRKPAPTASTLVNGLDRIYDYLVARNVIKRVGRHAYELLDATKIAGASEADRDRAAEAIEALGRLMKVREVDEEQAYHVVAEAIEAPYEIGTTV